MVSETERFTTIQVRKMTPADMEAVLSIEMTSSADPWSQLIIQGEFDSSLSCILVATIGGTIVGYLDYWIVADEIQIQNIVVREDSRRRGMAARLLEAMAEDAIRLDIHTASLEVRRSNERAIKLYGKFGFVVQGCRPRYYSDNREDALIMETDLKKTVKERIL